MIGLVWSHSAAVTAMHPIGVREVGYDAVAGSFDQVASLASGGKVELKDQQVRIVGDAAYEIGSEVGQIKLGGQQVAIDHRVTNIYAREGIAWKLVHHHADASPAMQEALNRIMAGSK
jgi:ketosteroid isomerase-like protein